MDKQKGKWKYDQQKKEKGTNNDLQNAMLKIKDQATWTSLKTGGGGELMYSSFHDPM